ncbi:MAG: aminotransferase class I/II-fold pyridoxal phosphate-dependent enzyme [Cellvibrionaceae bacterium]
MAEDKLLSNTENQSSKVVSYVNRVLKNGQLYRYEGNSPNQNDVPILEQEFSHYVGAKYAVAMNSCGSSLFVSLLCAGIKPGDPVLTSGFTFTAVPSAIVQAGGRPKLVEMNEDYGVDIDDLREKITDETKIMVLSHMRGHASNMSDVTSLCREYDITLIEDAAHAFGMTWNGAHLGTLGDIGCYSMQSYKLIGAGEGGMLITNNEHFAAQAIIYSGCYESLWLGHLSLSKLVENYQDYLPSFSLRMSNLTAAVIRAKLADVSQRIKQYRVLYTYFVNQLQTCQYFRIPERDPRLKIAPNSIQFTLQNMTEDQQQYFVKLVNANGIKLVLLGDANSRNARCFWNWKYLEENPLLPKTKLLLKSLCDMRLTATSTAEIDQITTLLISSVETSVKTNGN